MKISFDFDSTLAEERMQRLAKKLIQAGNEIWITTSRMDNQHGRPEWNTDLLAVANKLQIPYEHIQLTNGADKWTYLKGFDLHFDDDQIEIELIEENLTECVGVLIYDS
jgi:hypothetical protein